MKQIMNRIKKQFRCFGGGDTRTAFNPIAAALKDEPLQFAAGVDVASVVRVILDESGHDDLLEACKGLHGALSRMIDKHDPDSIEAEWLAESHEAITKAEGAK